MSGTLVWMMFQNPCVAENTESWAVAEMFTLSQTMPVLGHVPAQPVNGKKAIANIL